MHCSVYKDECYLARGLIAYISRSMMSPYTLHKKSSHGSSMLWFSRVQGMCGLAGSRGAVLSKYESNIIKHISHGRTASDYVRHVQSLKCTCVLTPCMRRKLEPGNACSRQQ